MTADKGDLVERIELHLRLKDSSPGFHLSDADFAAIVRSLRENAEHEANARAYEEIIGKKTYREVAEELHTSRELCTKFEAAVGEDVAEILTIRTHLASARKALEDHETWCAVERSKLGAVDGYDYRSGEEYGLRRAEIEISKRLATLKDISQ